MTKANSQLEYWWASEDPADIAQELRPKTNMQAAWANNPMYQTFYRNMYIYYSNIIKPTDWDTGLIFTGRQGELIEMLVPQAKSLVRQVVGLLSKQRLAFSVLADSKQQSVLQAVRLGNAVAKNIVRETSLDQKYQTALEHEMLTGMSFLHGRWRTDRGEFFAKDLSGRQHFKGAFDISVPSIWDVAFDPTIPNPLDWDWVMVREVYNRWDLIAQKPEMAQQILGLPSVIDQQGRFFRVPYDQPGQHDLVYVYVAYHRVTPAMPKGRMVVFCDDTTVISDTPNYYKCLPVYVSRPNALLNSSFGDPFFSMLVPLQDMLDTCLSSIATNNSNFAVQTISAPKGAEIVPDFLFGMNLMTYTPTQAPGGGEPKALQLTQSSPETFKFADVLNKYMQELSLVNSAMRGDPPSQVSSGTAIATLTATALESIHASAKSSREQVRKVVMGGLRAEAVFASVERSVRIDGSTGQAFNKEYTGKDLDGIRDIELQEINPIMMTLAGRIDQAEKLLDKQMVTDTKAYFAILNGAPTEVLYENELSSEDLVNMENEALLMGGEVIVLNTDDHAYHIMKHKILLNDPSVRLDRAVAKRVQAHILEHYEEANNVDPFFQAMAVTGKMPEGGPPMLPPAGPGGDMVPPPDEGKQVEKKPAPPAEPAQDQVARMQGAV